MRLTQHPQVNLAVTCTFALTQHSPEEVATMNVSQIHRAGYCYRRTYQKKYVARFVLVVLGAILTVGVAYAGMPMTAPNMGSSQISGQVVFKGTGFNVMNVQLVLGSTLHFSNPGKKRLDIRIVTWRGKPVKALSIPAHGHADWKPMHYGIYDYFNAETTRFGSVTIRGSGGEKVDQPVARKSSKTFPAPAYGIVAVTNTAGGGIPLSRHYGVTEVPYGSTLTGKHRHAFMRHTPWLEVTGATMTFKPWVLVVRAGQPIQLFNEDSMDHAFFPGYYPVMYQNRQVIRSYYYGFRGFLLNKNGSHRPITFYLPGIHHVFCAIHTFPWKYTYKSRRHYGGYPYVMDTVIYVEPRSVPR